MRSRTDQLLALLRKQVNEITKILEETEGSESLRPHQLDRWRGRTARILRENLGDGEAEKFKTYWNDSSLSLFEETEDRARESANHLVALMKDIEEHPEDFETKPGAGGIGKVGRGKRPARVFITHGRSDAWREVQAYIEKDLKTGTLELAQEPNMGRTVLQKLDQESDKCSFAVVVMTGDDQVAGGAPRARENVIHEIGFFQGKFGLSNVCLLHEEGTNIPSNIGGLVYIPFPKNLVRAAFGDLTRELRVAFPGAG